MRLRYSLENATPVERANILRRELGKADRGAHVDVGAGYDYDLGIDRIRIPEGVILLGDKKNPPTFRSRDPYQQACQVELSHQCEVHWIRGRNDTANVNDPGVGIGFSQASTRPDAFAYLLGLDWEAREECLFNWGPTGCRIAADYSSFRSGKWAAVAGTCRGPGNLGVFFEFYKTLIEADTRLGTVGGHSGRMAIGLAVRGGTTLAYESWIHSIGYPVDPEPYGPTNLKTVTEQAAVWLGMPEVAYRNQATHASVELHNTECQVITFPGVEWWDVREQLNSYDGGKTSPGRALVVGGHGSLQLAGNRPSVETFKTFGKVAVL
jgi:hypothetical protein